MGLADEMMVVFGLPPRFWAEPLAWYAGRWVCNPMVLQRALELRKHEIVVDGEALADFVRRHYGDQAVELVGRAIKGEAWK